MEIINITFFIVAFILMTRLIVFIIGDSNQSGRSDRMIHPRRIQFGESPLIELPCGCCYIDRKTGKDVEVKIMTMGEFFKSSREELKCRKVKK